MSEPIKNVVLSDMSLCQPQEALSTEPKPGCWRLMDYELEDGTPGVMAFAVPGEGAGEITLPLKVKGVYKIYIGINYTKNPFSQWSSNGHTRVRLSSDSGFASFTCEAKTDKGSGEKGEKVVSNSREIYKFIHEVYWKTASLDGESLHIKPMGSGSNPQGHGQAVANISRIRLVPADEQDLALEKALSRKIPNIAVLWCGGLLTGSTDGGPMYHPTDSQWFRDEMASFIGNDVGIVSLEVLRGNLCLFNSKTGDIGSEKWLAEWPDPLKQMVKIAHENGIKAFTSLRTIGPTCPLVVNPISRAEHFWHLKQFAKRDAEGMPMTNLSLAFPEVRQHWLNLLRETLNYGVDGITIYFHRCHPLVYYEDPVVETFEEQYQTDPRILSEDDPRWQRHSSGYVTQFLKEIRHMLDEEPGRELAVTLKGFTRAPKDEKDSIRAQFDVDTWIQSGIVDYLMPDKRTAPEFFLRWRRLGGEKLHIWAGLMPRSQPGQAYLALAQSYLELGADGFHVWDAERRHPRMSEWAIVRNLGHREQYEELGKLAAGTYSKVLMRSQRGLSHVHSYRDG